MSEDTNRRQYERFSSSLAIEVSMFDNSGQPVSEKTFLRDISGGGISFVCFNPDTYNFGQSLDLVIYSNDGNNPQSHDIGSGKVMWLNEADDDSPAWVGVMLDNLLGLDHLNLKLQVTDA